jgi:hypothetical protein
MSHPHTLTSLTEREAVADALYRLIIGFDSNDVSIFNSALTADAEMGVINGSVYTGLDAIRTQLLGVVGPMYVNRGALIFLFGTVWGVNTLEMEQWL